MTMTIILIIISMAALHMTAQTAPNCATMTTMATMIIIMIMMTIIITIYHDAALRHRQRTGAEDIVRGKHRVLLFEQQADVIVRMPRGVQYP